MGHVIVRVKIQDLYAVHRSSPIFILIEDLYAVHRRSPIFIFVLMNENKCQFSTPNLRILNETITKKSLANDLIFFVFQDLMIKFLF